MEEEKVTTSKDCLCNVCAKCGHLYNDMKYDSPADNLRLICTRCGYIWRKDPLDKKRSDDEV